MKSENSRSKKISPKRIYFFIYILMIILGIFLASLIFSFIEKPKKIITPQPISKIPVTLETEKIEPIEEKKLPEDIPTFNLSGILFSDTEKWVLIDNRILKEGDTIKGAKVMRILDTEVELDWEGERIFLKLK